MGVAATGRVKTGGGAAAPSSWVGAPAAVLAAAPAARAAVVWVVTRAAVRVAGEERAGAAVDGVRWAAAEVVVAGTVSGTVAAATAAPSSPRTVGCRPAAAAAVPVAAAAAPGAEAALPAATLLRLRQAARRCSSQRLKHVAQPQHSAQVSHVTRGKDTRHNKARVRRAWDARLEAGRVQRSG